MEITDKQIGERALYLATVHTDNNPLKPFNMYRMRGYESATILRLKDARRNLRYMNHDLPCHINTDAAGRTSSCTCGFLAHIAELERLLGITPSTPEQ